MMIDNIILVAGAFLVSCFHSAFEKSGFRVGKVMRNGKFYYDSEILVVGGL